MATQAKGLKSYRKAYTETDKFSGQSYKKLVFAHQFIADNETDLDLLNLNLPTDLSVLGFTNPSSLELASANLALSRQNLRLASNVKGLLMDYISYDVITDTKIRLKNGAESSADEVIMGYIEPVASSNVQAIDGVAVVKSGIIAVGYTDFTVDPFLYNKYPNQQAGDVLVYVDGILQARCVGNNISGEGNYIEVAPSSGNLASIIRLKYAVTGSDANLIVVSNGLVVERPNASLLSRLETLAGTVDVLVDDVAIVTGNPTSRYQTVPNDIDLKNFGQLVYAMITETIYNCIVGSSDQFDKFKCTHTSVQAAIDACPTGGSILVLNNIFTENITINKKLMIVGKGHGSVINGTLICQPNCDYSTIKNLKFADDITFDSGADGNFFRECFLASGKIVTNNGSGNSIQYIGE